MLRINLTGQVFSRLTVNRYSHTAKGRAIWECVCSCGKVCFVQSSCLIRGNTKSCGCLNLEKIKIRATTHGNTNTPEYEMWSNAKTRAKKIRQEFNLDYKDINIPEFCPILGIKLDRNSGRDSSPSLDRINPALGYVKGNIWVISNKANRLKSNLTVDEWDVFIDKTKKALDRYRELNESFTQLDLFN